MSAKNGAYVSKVNSTWVVHCIGLSTHLRAPIATLCYSTMPAERHTMCQRDKCSNDPKYEEHIQMAIEAIDAGKYNSYKAASIQMNVRLQV
jgi:hypothetical protein